MRRLRDRLNAETQALGFDVFAITTPEAVFAAEHGLAGYLAAGHHGSMAWMEETARRRANPKALWPDVRTIIVVGLNYGPDEDPLAVLARADRGAISVYARNRDYHDIIKGRLKQLAHKLVAWTGAEVKVFVDTAPVMEKPLAAAAGIGWQGKHTNLVSREFGSWLFLGEIFTTADLSIDEASGNHCGECRACLDVCPTGALPAPYRLDARRCISYLTIELKGSIPRPLRPLMGNRIYGCDDCLAVCPWNKFARSGREVKLAARDELRAPPLRHLATLDDRAFRAYFSGSPIKRIGRDRFLRNVLIAIGNSADRKLIASAESQLADPNPLVREAAIWALSRLMTKPEFFRLAAGAPFEADATVRAEWAAGGIEHGEPDR